MENLSSSNLFIYLTVVCYCNFAYERIYKYEIKRKRGRGKKKERIQSNKESEKESIIKPSSEFLAVEM
jgi:hypothetical protein